MKKIITGALVAFVGLSTGVVYAETNQVNSVAYTEMNYAEKNQVNNKEVLTRIVARVLEMNAKGISKENIIKELSSIKDLNLNYLDEKKDLTKDKIKENLEMKKEYLADSSVAKNFGQYKKTMRQGDHDGDVMELQAKLNELKTRLGIAITELKVDGKYGPATAGLVKMIQKREGLSQDGVVGPKTLQQLVKLLEKKVELKDKKDSDDKETDSTDDDEEDDNDENEE